MSSKTAVAIRHVAFEDLGLLEKLLPEHGFTTSYLDAPTASDWSPARDADLLIVLGGPIGVADEEIYPFLKPELEVITERVTADRPTLGVCLGAQLMAVAIGGSVGPGTAAEIGYAAVTLTDAGRDSVLAPLEDVPVLHWHGDVITTPPEIPPLATTTVCAHQAFARGSNLLALQFHLEAEPSSLESWLVGHTYELSKGGISINGLRDDAAKYGPQLAAAALEVFDPWLSGLTFG